MYIYHDNKRRYCAQITVQSTFIICCLFTVYFCIHLNYLGSLRDRRFINCVSLTGLNVFLMGWVTQTGALNNFTLNPPPLHTHTC